MPSIAIGFRRILSLPSGISLERMDLSEPTEMVFFMESGNEIENYILNSQFSIFNFSQPSLPPPSPHPLFWQSPAPAAVHPAASISVIPQQSRRDAAAALAQRSPQR